MKSIHRKILCGIISCALTFLMIGVFVQEAVAVNYLFENWDSDTPPSGWPCKNAPTSCTHSTFHGWYNETVDYCRDFPEWASTGLSTTKAKSGARSFFQYRKAGVSESCDIRWDFSQPYPTNIYIGFWLHLDSNFINFNTPTTREPSYHFFFTNSAQSLTGLRINLLAKVPWTSSWQCGPGRGGIPSTQPYAFFSVQDYDREWPVGTYPAGCYNLLEHLNEWVWYEFNLNANTNTVKIWSNGTLVYQGTDRITQTNFTYIMLSNYMSSEDGTGFATSYYIDDFTVSDSYIGPGEKTAPNSPTGLRVLE